MYAARPSDALQADIPSGLSAVCIFALVVRDSLWRVAASTGADIYQEFLKSSNIVISALVIVSGKQRDSRCMLRARPIGALR